MVLHLLTGANCYVGSFIAGALIAQGESVSCVDINENTLPFSGMEYHQLYVLDKKELLRVMRGVDYVHHNAALGPLRKAGDRFREVNVEGIRSVVTGRRAGRCKAHFTYEFFGSFWKCYRKYVSNRTKNPTSSNRNLWTIKTGCREYYH